MEQLIDSIPEKWKFIIKKNYENAANLITYYHHLIKPSRAVTLDKLTSTKIYSILILKVQNKPSSNICFKNLFNENDIGWTAIYLLPCLVTNNFLIKKLHIFGIKSSPLCSFCNLYNKTPFHIFYECDHVKSLWSDLVLCFQNTLILLTLTTQTTIFGILDSVSNDSFFENNKVFITHILLIFMLYVYKSREMKFINVNNLIAEIQKAKKTEK